MQVVRLIVGLILHDAFDLLAISEAVELNRKRTLFSLLKMFQVNSGRIVNKENEKKNKLCLCIAAPLSNLLLDQLISARTPGPGASV